MIDIDVRIAAAAVEARMVMDRQGWVVQPVFGEGITFCYTVGLSHSYGHPEIYVCGLGPELGCHVLNGVAARVAKGKDFSETCYDDGVLEELDVAFRPMAQALVDENSRIGQEILGRAFKAVQMIFPDRSGRFPWEEGCDPEIASMQEKLFRTVGEPPRRA